MPLLKKIKLTQYRNYSFQAWNTDAPIVAISGLNGSGKTNLLDAIYYLCYTKSYFQGRELNNVQNGQNGFRIEGLWQTVDEEASVACVWKENKKTIFYNDVPYERITEHIGKLNAVMIAPDDTALINEGSEQRRRFVDAILSAKDLQYLQQLLQYQKILNQRNAYLKQCVHSFDHDLLDVYDQSLVQSGRYLIEARIALSEKMPALVQDMYAQLCNGQEQINMSYRPCAAPDLLLEKMYAARPRDMDLRRSTMGPHTEDWLFYIDGQAMKMQASQGQKKSFLISLKLAQIKMLTDAYSRPILLLDDIFEKLDQQRLQQLFNIITQMHLPQIFITHTKGEDLKQYLDFFKEEKIFINLER